MRFPHNGFKYYYHGIKRITGRIKRSEIFEQDRKGPILLPSSSPVYSLILMDIRQTLCHPGHNRVVAESRKRFWISNVRRLVKNIGFKFVVCRLIREATSIKETKYVFVGCS